MSKDRIEEIRARLEAATPKASQERADLFWLLERVEELTESRDNFRTGQEVVYEELTALSAERDRLAGELVKINDKRAPVQGYSPGIPWEMHLRAYDAYSKKYGRQDALIDLEGRNCRGGFGCTELDMFVPGWREELSERTKLITERDEALARIARIAAETKERCAKVLDRRAAYAFSNCDHMGMTDPETGVGECSLAARGQDCLCQERFEEAESLAAAIRAMGE